MTASPRSPNEIDTKVGARVRMRRMEIGMSQEHLAEQCGITFQQIQKYERGTNRVGAGRLWQIGKALDVPVTYFYSDVEPGDEPQNIEEAGGEPRLNVSVIASDKKMVRLIKAFDKLPAKKKTSFLNLLEDTADG